MQQHPAQEQSACVMLHHDQHAADCGRGQVVGYGGVQPGSSWVGAAKAAARQLPDLGRSAFRRGPAAGWTRLAAVEDCCIERGLQRATAAVVSVGTILLARSRFPALLNVQYVRAHLARRPVGLQVYS